MWEGGGDCSYITLDYEVRGYRPRSSECVMYGGLYIYIYIYIKEYIYIYIYIYVCIYMLVLVEIVRK